MGQNSGPRFGAGPAAGAKVRDQRRIIHRVATESCRRDAVQCDRVLDKADQGAGVLDNSCAGQWSPSAVVPVVDHEVSSLRRLSTAVSAVGAEAGGWKPAQETGRRAFKLSLWTWRAAPGHKGQDATHRQVRSQQARRGLCSVDDRRQPIERPILSPGFHTHGHDTTKTRRASSPRRVSSFEADSTPMIGHEHIGAMDDRPRKSLRQQADQVAESIATSKRELAEASDPKVKKALKARLRLKQSLEDWLRSRQGYE